MILIFVSNNKFLINISFNTPDKLQSLSYVRIVGLLLSAKVPLGGAPVILPVPGLHVNVRFLAQAIMGSVATDHVAYFAVDNIGVPDAAVAYQHDLQLHRVLGVHPVVGLGYWREGPSLNV